jgi:hypothetical protein
MQYTLKLLPIFHDPFNSPYIASTDMTINELRTGNDAEGSGIGLI